MNELLKIEVNKNNEPTISGRLLHEFLEVGTRYDVWFNRMVEYGFKEGEDFNSFKNEQVHFFRIFGKTYKINLNFTAIAIRDSRQNQILKSSIWC